MLRGVNNDSCLGFLAKRVCDGSIKMAFRGLKPLSQSVLGDPT